MSVDNSGKIVGKLRLDKKDELQLLENTRAPVAQVDRATDS